VGVFLSKIIYSIVWKWGMENAERLMSSIFPFGMLFDLPPMGGKGVISMQDPWIGRRAYPRIDMSLPVYFGLINIKGGKKPKACFSGETMDISMKGLGIRMNCHVLHMISIAIDMILT
jgi:hypothetical protein